MNPILRNCATSRRFVGAIVLMCGAALMMGAAFYPSGLNGGGHSPADAILSGLYPSPDRGSCCWLADRGVLRVEPPSEAQALVLIFAVPNYAPFKTRSERLSIRLDEARPQVLCCYGPGEHAALVMLPRRGAGPMLIRIAAGVTFVPKELGLNEDPRRLSVLVRSLQFRSGSGLMLGGAGSSEAEAESSTPLGLAFCGVVLIVAALLARRRPAYAIALLVVIGPFGPTISLGITTLNFFKAAVVGTLLGSSPRAPWRNLWQRREALVPLACAGALFLACLASLLHARYHVPVFRESLKYVEYAIVFAVSFLAYRIEPDRRPISVAFILVTVAVCCAAILDEGNAPETALVLGHIVPRIAGPLEGPNQLAGWLEMVVPVLLCVRLQPRLRAAGTIAVVLAIATSMFTLSRAGAVGMLVGIVVFAFASQRAEGRQLRPFGIIASLAAVALLAYRAFPTGNDDAFNGGLGTRSELWRAAVTLWRSSPLTGVGAGNYESLLSSVGLIGIRTHANSWYLQGLAEGGILMLSAIAGTIYGLVATFISSRALLATAALAATAAICAHQILDDLIFFPKVGVMWFLILGIGAAAAAEANGPVAGVARS